MKKLRLAQIMMIGTIVLIAAFQTYWLVKLYNDEWKDVKKETDVIFRDAIYKLQVARFKRDSVTFKKFSSDSIDDNLFNIEAINVLKNAKTRVPPPKKDSAKVALAMANEVIKERHPQIQLIKLDSSVRERSGGRQIKIITRGNSGDVMQFVSSLQDLKDTLHFAGNDSTEQPNKANIRVDYVGNIQKRFPSTPAPATPPNRLKKTGFQKVEAPPKAPRKRIEFFEGEDGPSIRVFSNTRSFNDSLPVVQVDSIYRKELLKASIKIPYTVTASRGKKTEMIPAKNELKTNPASVGFLSPYYYQASFQNPFSYIITKIAPQIVLSLLLIAFTVGSFIVLYRNLMAQRKLADIKNEFISNITHELKTPIATVNVAIEAMKNFNALHNPERTKEYLDISQSELQRLSLLVDKVLKLSMFEKKEIELKKEWFNVDELVKEVMATMRLQFEKCKAKVSLQTCGNNFDTQADRLHITSVVYNLLDNALKYSKSNPIIDVEIKDEGDKICLSVADNGIGIPHDYKDKIFEKFFRVPSNNTHNAKGYGLGLSYVCHIINQHNGNIKVESEPGTGSCFIIHLPK